jgi:hypothetical protein
VSVFSSFDEALRVVPREAAPCYRVTIKPAHDLTAQDRAQWASLWARAGHENIFAADWFMASALEHCAPPRGVRLAVVHTAGGVWLGVLPLSLESTIGRCPMPSLHNWQCTNQFDASPLIERGAEHIFWHALLTFLDRSSVAACALYLEGLPLDDPATRALIEVCLAGERRLEQTARCGRPMLAHFGSVAAAPEALSPARRKLDKRLDSLLRKLQREVGDVRFVSHERGGDPADWIDRFLALEQLGWKGQAESALGSNGHTERLFRAVLTAAWQSGAARLMSLEAGGEAIAMTSWLSRKQRAYGFKMAYAETHRAYAPGRLLMRAVADEIARGPAVLFDTCARADAPPDPLWPQTRELANYALPIGGRARRGLFAAIMRARLAWQSNTQ